MYLSFTGLARHPIVRGKGRRTFLTIRFAKFVSINGNQQAAYRQAMLAEVA